VPPVVFNGLMREMEEETGIVMEASNMEFFTLIEDKSNPVGRVHTGVLFLIDLPITEDLKKQIVSKSEINDIVEVKRSELTMLLNAPDTHPLEGWAKLVIQDFVDCPEC